MATLISYLPIDYFSDSLGVSPGFYRSKIGQAFSTGDTRYNISSCKFYISKAYNPTGLIVAKLYASQNYLPTGNALATSETVDVTSLSSDFALVTFNFSSTYYMAANTVYVITLEYDGGDYVDVGLSVESGGASHYWGSTWEIIDPAVRLIYYVYGELPATNTGGFMTYFLSQL